MPELALADQFLIRDWANNEPRTPLRYYRRQPIFITFSQIYVISYRWSSEYADCEIATTFRFSIDNIFIGFIVFVYNTTVIYRFSS